MHLHRHIWSALMATLGLNHINLRAQPELLEKLRTFYCEAVGLTVGLRPAFKSIGYWLYAGENAVLHLSQITPDEAQPVSALTTFSHVAFSCTDVVAFEQRLIQLGLQYRISQVPLTSQVQIFLKDPAGNGVELNFGEQRT
jgi:catechol-2,3-dioxygenase